MVSGDLSKYIGKLLQYGLCPHLKKDNEKVAWKACQNFLAKIRYLFDSSCKLVGVL